MLPGRSRRAASAVGGRAPALLASRPVLLFDVVVLVGANGGAAADIPVFAGEAST